MDDKLLDQIDEVWKTMCLRLEMAELAMVELAIVVKAVFVAAESSWAVALVEMPMAVFNYHPPDH